MVRDALLLALRLDLVMFKRNDRSCWPSRATTRQAVASYSSTGSIVFTINIPYHHIADIPMRGYDDELRLIVTTPNRWSTAGYHRHGRCSTVESNKPRTARTAMKMHRICIPATVRSSGDDCPRMILRRSQEACRELVLSRSAGRGRT